MRKDIAFKTADGLTLRGWHYVPAKGKLPTIVMAHGFSATKELFLDNFAEAFAAAGFAVLVYDNRNLGASDGEPRQEIDPMRQVSDYRDAITFAETLPETDAARIGIWGSSYSGSHVMVVGALDRRVKCVVSQVPLISGYNNFRRLVRYDLISGVQAMFDADRRQRAAGGAPAMIPVVADAGAPSALPTQESYDWLVKIGLPKAPGWRNEVTLKSVEMFTEYFPGNFIPYIAPTPFMMIVALGDTLLASTESLAAYETALQPKKLVLIPGGHFDPYVTYFKQSSTAACDWFGEHLKG